MIVIPGLSRPLEAVGRQVVSWDDSDSRLSVEVGGLALWAACPRCTCGSSRTHGRYRRRLADTPAFDLSVTLAVEVCRFKCINHHCPQRTFSERIEPLAGAGQRRTQRLREAQRSVDYALGGAAAARLAARLGMGTAAAQCCASCAKPAARGLPLSRLSSVSSDIRNERL
jgi:transposase